VNAWSRLSRGGAQTTSWRVLGNSKYWYADEEMPDSALNDAIAIYKETSPKIVISHTVPSEAAKEILKDLNGSYFFNKHGDVESRTSKASQEMFEAHQPSAIRRAGAGRGWRAPYVICCTPFPSFLSYD